MPRDYFLKKPNEYQRNLDIIGEANKATALNLSLKFSKPFDECLAFVENRQKEKPLEPIKIKGLIRQDNQDRKKTIVSIDKLIAGVEKRNMVLAPNLVIYDSEESNPSIHSAYISNKMANRKKIKRLGLESKQRGDLDTFALCNNLEYNIKVLINSESGACSSPHNPFYNPTAHSSMTSNTRVMASYSNASAERFLSSNRHYWSKEIVIENILTVINNTDIQMFQTVMNKYQFIYPTTDDVMNLIKRSTDFYWQNNNAMEQIKRLVNKLTPLQKAIFTYTGDFYALLTLNPEFVRSFINEFLEAIPNYSGFDLDEIVNEANPGVSSFAGIICADFLTGKTISDVKKETPELYTRYADTILFIEEKTDKYGDFLKTFYFSENIPPYIYAYPVSIRRTVVGGDTDSTMFTVQQFITWYYGKLVFTHESHVISNLIAYLNNAIVEHILAVMSKQIGVDDSKLFVLKMKNEYMFPLYFRANRSKHYATLLFAREGIVYLKPEIEVKGVALKDSKTPRSIMNRLEEEFLRMMHEILDTGSIEVIPIIRKIANLEHQIIRSLKSGSIEYLSGMNVGIKEAYKKPMSGAYFHYLLWKEVWETKYTAVSEPPYRAVKCSMDLDNKTKLKAWIETLEPTLKNAIEAFNQEYKKEKYSQMLLPFDIVANGLPVEIVNALDIRSITAELTRGFYILLEICGIYLSNKNNSKMPFEMFPEDLSFGLPGTPND